jgi:hypothetical protein
MESVDAKIDRAEEHFGVFRSELRAFSENCTPNIVLKVNDMGLAPYLIFWMDAGEPPIRLSVLLGDCVFNLRSALDNLVCGLARSVNPQDTCTSRRFPISTNEAKYRKGRNESLRGVSDQAKKLIDELQPWRRPINTMEADPLHLLNCLCNYDKHRSLHFTAGYSQDVQFVVSAENGRPLTHVSIKGPVY